MKTRVSKLLAILLSLLMLIGAAVLPMSADGTEGTPTETPTTPEETPSEGETTPKTNHELTGNELLKKYGLDCQSEDAEDGSNPDVKEAKITSVNGNAYLQFTWGESKNYPIILLTGIPDDMTDYTVSVDVIADDSNNNKLFNLLYAGVGSNYGEFGFRTGAYTEGKTFAEIKWNKLAARPADSEIPYIGRGDYESLSTATGTVHTLSVTVKADALDTVPTVTGTISGINVPNTCDTKVSSSVIGFSGWKLSVWGIDNIIVTNNKTGEVVCKIDFEDHNYGTETQPVDETYHGVVCTCGVPIAVEHTWNEGVEIDDETSCTTKKSLKRTCTVCEYERVFANAHTPGEKVVVNDTCTEDGYTSITCTTCNEELEHTVLESDGHDFGMWSKIENGMERTCTTCGLLDQKLDEVETEAKTEAATQAPTTTDTTTEKSGCGAVVVSAVVPALLIGGALMLTKKKKED